MRICNKSGISGVYKRDDGTEKARWVAQVTGLETYKKYSKSFSVSKYGNEEALRLACLWKESKLSELNEQGAGFTERHGKPQLNSD